ncbi:DUF6712 family protein [uncultured Pontibacter sp.]|uniref:DUF6712 family protein n=1 Tax=uncultured Pontibacter sp. TaxID=453356 RepID=UPI00260A51F5|nr:DUF6712 family protein [uncultured Pontibacter sp.]
MLNITTEDLKKRIGVTATAKALELYQADFFQVQDDILRVSFGEDFYLDLSQKYNEGLATEKQLELVAILLDAIVPMAQGNLLPLQALQISDRGVHIVSNANEKTPFEHQIKAAQASFAHKGFQAIERALRFLERHIDHPDFELWATSEACTLFRQHTISNAEEFQNGYSIGNSRRTYMALLPTVRKVEDFYLETALGGDFWYELKEQLKDRDVHPDNLYLLNRFIRPAVALLTVAAALEEGGYTFKTDAFLLSDSAEPVDAAILNSKRAKAEKDGKAYLSKLTNYLNANASAEKYATYFASSTYLAPGSEVSRNEPESRIYGFY